MATSLGCNYGRGGVVASAEETRAVYLVYLAMLPNGLCMPKMLVFPDRLMVVSMAVARWGI